MLGVVPDAAVRVTLLDAGNADGYGAAVVAPLPGTGSAISWVDAAGNRQEWSSR